MNLLNLIPEIGQLKNLQTLELGSNELNNLPPEIGHLNNLKRLFLQSNQLIELPPEIGQLNSLKWLSLGGNKLVSLPPEIGQLTSLQKLDLYDNQLIDLPPEIGHLNNLQRLGLSENSLSNLPIEIGLLFNLKDLSIDDNHIKELPKTIFNLKLDESSWGSIIETLSPTKNYSQMYLTVQKIVKPNSSDYDNLVGLSVLALLAKQPQEAIDAAKKALFLNPEKTDVYNLLFLGYLLNNQYKKSEKIYLEWKNKIFLKDLSFSEALLLGIADLEAANIHHPDFQKAKQLLQQ